MEKKKLKVYQIGLSGIGRYGFEKLVELTKSFSQVDVEIAGVYDRDYERLERAERFAEANRIEINNFQEMDRFYSNAKTEDEKVMVYDAGTADSRPENIHRSVENGFFHVAEKPPSTKREDHIKEKKLAERYGVMWKVDFVERENPVVKKALEIVRGKNIEEIKIFRESSTGVEKVLDPEKRLSTRGGDILDNMVNEIYLMDFLEASGETGEEKIILELENAESGYFLPGELGSEKLMSMKGSKTREIGKASTAQTQAQLSFKDVSISLNSSWVGLSRETMIESKNLQEKTGHQFYDRDFSELDKKAYTREEARFFVLEGEINLAGDLLHNKLYNLDTGEEIETDSFIHDQLYRVLEEAVKRAAGEEENTVSWEKTEGFMEALFDIQDAVTDGKPMEEASKGSKKIKKLIVEDSKLREVEQGAKAG